MKREIVCLMMLAFAVCTSAKEYHGIVRDSITSEVLDFATVRAYGSDSMEIANAVTDSKGEFRFSASKDVKRIVVSFIGFRARVITRDEGFESEIGEVRLAENTLLQDVVISRKLVNQDVAKMSILVTDSLRKETTRASELLDKLYGVKVDWITGKLKVFGEGNVLVLVNGKKVDQAYALNISPETVRTIDIVQHPAGKYSEYGTVVDLILKNDYQGTNLSFGTKDVYSYKNRHTNSENVFGDITYSTSRWNVYASLNGNRKDTYNALAYSRCYDRYQTHTADADEYHPNSKNHFYSASLNGGVDYKINTDHTVSFQTWNEYKHNKDRKNYALDITDNGMKSQNTQTERDSYRSLDHIIGLYYKGNFAGKLDLSTELTYNYYHVNDSHGLTYDTDLPAQSQYRGEKNYLSGSVSADWQVTKRLSLWLYYRFTARSYVNRDDETDQKVYTSDDTRHMIYASLSYHFSDQFQINSGSGFLLVSEKNGDAKKDHNSWLPYFKLYYSPWKGFSLTGYYNCTVNYPNLDQLSTANWSIDGRMLHVGNPNLKPVVLHYATASLKIDKWFTLTYLQRKAVDDISPYYYNDGKSFYESYMNSQFSLYYINMMGEYDLMKGLHLYAELSYQDYHRSKSGFASRYGKVYTIDTNLSYKIAKLKLNCMCAYFLRHEKEPLLQGCKYNEEETLAFGLNRVFCKGRLSTSLLLSIPVSTIPKQEYTDISIEGYRAKNISDDRVNNCLVQARVSFNIDGKASRHIHNPSVDQEK